jgi:hypothetical protein
MGSLYIIEGALHGRAGMCKLDYSLIQYLMTLQPLLNSHTLIHT